MVDHRETDWQNGDPEETVLASWSKHKRKNDAEASVPTEISQAPDLPLPSTQVQGRPAEQRQRKLGRRQLLIGGVAAATVAAASGLALVTVFTRTKSSQSARPTPTPIPGPRAFVAGKAVVNISGHSDRVNVVAWDPSGRYLASAGQDSNVMLWDLGSILQTSPTSLQALNQPMHRWKFAQAILATDMAWAPDGRSLAVSAGDPGKFYMIDAITGNSVPRSILNTTAIKNAPYGTDAPNYNSLTWRPNTNIVAGLEQTFPQTAKVDYWQADKSSDPVGSYTYNDPSQSPGDTIGLGVINWSPDGSLLAGFLTNLKAVVWNAQKKNVRAVIDLPDRIINHQSPFVYRFALIWSPIDPNLFAVFDMDIIAVCDARKSQPLYLLGTNDTEAYTPPPNNEGLSWTPQVHGISWSPNGRYIAASYSRSSRISVWDLEASNPQVQNGIRLQQYLFPQANEPGHNSTVFDLAWSPNGRYLATGSYDKTIIIWQVDES